MIDSLGYPQEIMVGAVIQRMHCLVTNGPRDLDVASAMIARGYDEVKWADGQGRLAELIASEVPPPSILQAALAWYEEASGAARHALSTQPKLLDKLGLV